MKVTEIKPPNKSLEYFDTTIFLAGAIDMGEATDWQKETVDYLKSKTSEEVDSVGIYNPRREDWNSSWKQELNNPQFFEQVSWELSYIDNCDVAIVYFTKDSKAPITLMELGKLSEIKEAHNVVVFCPEGYHRKGNVDVLCHTKGIPVYTEISEFHKALDRILSLKDESEKKVVESCDVDVVVENSNTLNESTNITLFENVETVSIGDKNMIVVAEYDEAENNSCIMGNITYKSNNFYAGICKEGDDTKVNLYFKRNGEQLSEMFSIVKVSDEHPEEKIVMVQ